MCLRQAHDPKPPAKICPMDVASGGAAFPELFLGCSRAFSLIG